MVTVDYREFNTYSWQSNRPFQSLDLNLKCDRRSLDNIHWQKNFCMELQQMKPENIKNSLRQRIDKIKKFRCKNLIAVIEDPTELRNIGTVIRNVNALGVEKAYVVDSRKLLPEDWQIMRERTSLLKTSASAVKWSFVKRFDDTKSCLEHLEKNGFVSIVTSPHVKGKNNISLDAGDFTPKKHAVWFGNESHGISDLALDSSEMCVSIPMYGIIESLNLGTTTGIVLYEITKQRRAFRKNRPNKIAETAPIF